MWISPQLKLQRVSAFFWISFLLFLLNMSPLGAQTTPPPFPSSSPVSESIPTSALMHSPLSIQTVSTPFFNGLRWVADMSSISRIRPDGSLVQLEESVGLDLYSELQTDTRHWGSFVFQLYVFRYDMLIHPNQDMNGKGQWAYAPCVIAPDLIILPQGKLNFKIGHIWPNYGLRNEINTTGTLRQLIDRENVGLIIDWGMELHGENSGVSYALTVSRGTGNGWSNEGNPYLITGRVAAVEGNLPFEIGLSGLHGRLKNGSTLLPRWRAGVDFQYYGPLNVLFEASIGQDYGLDDVFNMITEVNWTSPLEELTMYIQYR
jgi:hypothetical protein